ncbi:MAG TPA: hypothetical protein PLA65_20250 [Spirochaetota bacterium]|nr:hypothetical protein [Spirochaetota bacterium]HOD16968.1 hypothetical protein [Spirochaetota bacterium]HPN14401.1 hypothetical protein [Spirochaetota bacterium]
MKKVIKYIIYAIIVIIVFQISFFIGLPYKKTINITEDLSYIEWKKLNIYLLTPFCDSSCVIQLFPSIETTIFRQIFIHHNHVILEKNNNYYSIKVDYYKYCISPNKNYILFIDSSHVKPFIIYNIKDQKTIIIKSREIEGHYYSYPFSFMNWSFDSQTLYVTVEGVKFHKKLEYGNYKQIWKINPETGLIIFMNEEFIKK